MGIWDDAQQASSESRADACEQALRESQLAREQLDAIREFVDSMGRLGIPPTRQHFQKWTEPINPLSSSYFKNTRHSVIGWPLAGGVVVTAEGKVYEIRGNEKRTALDTSKWLSIWIGNDYQRSLRELLRDELVQAMER